MLKNFVPREPVETTLHELVFKLEDGQGSAFAFECDEHGHIFRDRLPRLALHNLDLCLQGEVDGFTVRRGVVRTHLQSSIADGGGRCVCGENVVLHSSWANGCESCGREYDGSGQLLADRAFWGEETGESVTDMELEHDPEELGDW